MLRPWTLNKNKGQATTELAIMGAIVLMLLSYLVSQGFLYNNRQALEMYTFRQALKLSKDQERGINLTVIRDVITPSFFTGLSRQRLMASSIVDYNPWIIWQAYDEDPEDTAYRQLVQVNDAMIKGGNFMEVPPTKSNTGDGLRWGTSTVEEIDPQTQPVRVSGRVSTYSSEIDSQENPNYIASDGFTPKQGDKKVVKKNESKDFVPIAITFEPAEKIQQNYQKENWGSKDSNPGYVSNAGSVPIYNIPANIVLNFSETLKRERMVDTENPKR